MNWREKLGPSRTRSDAFHEAGHVVMTWLLDLDFDIKSIDMHGNAEATALVHYRRNSVSPYQITANIADPRLAQLKAKQAVMISMAGPAAEDKHKNFEGDWFSAMHERHRAEYFETSPVDSDFGQANAAAQALHGDDDKCRFEFLRTVSLWSQEAVHDPRVWRMIELLATHLESSSQVIPYEKTVASVAISIIREAAGELGKERRVIWLLGDKWKVRLPYSRS